MYTIAERAILEALNTERHQWYLRELVKAMGEKILSREVNDKLLRRSVYKDLTRLIYRSLVECRWETYDEWKERTSHLTDSPRLRVYWITDEGIRQLSS
ncbi:MAG: hypothetical protein CO029_01710 [Candidatus Magasanikbacteria bacterium CG_4_9_14_0_2_um_filter_41_10]|uniref:Transcription regulator PadR N-terminal domain-containing protein n=1 Tax=Candidatus Magasanikbacteria bacterium CG_4_10_14_0_2_um_filter_41_31 TaxID=1974639 RepID=A0A2M7V488_9BACT|nr:MAG: hypothetical protein AUJ37_00760 [Candidatus Magasanikbacteria bacterium CG1_02_41_34]PIZ93356.1 MAG: hypothetical protein COX83_02235 [Candidatus Magasanikbacteria bacterium CG_4_10_14_0_2_um_filter_41_31]PJC53641.1 MAG: hypothetical protein CO029_01710 [Candidatus Magasanikbacteria bacterium CG_4_9_14_0_2_um_filter_41_10]